VNRLVAVIPAVIVLIVAVSMGSERHCWAIPSGQFLSSQSLVVAARSLRSECSANEVSKNWLTELRRTRFPGVSWCTDQYRLWT